MKNISPICLFVYNRLDELHETIIALQKNYLAHKSNLYIFSDGAKNNTDKYKVNKVREYIKTIKKFKSINIIESPINLGLANSIIKGVDMVVNKYGKAIILEDDLITTPNFLNFMNEALFFYSENKIIKSINGFSLFLESNKNDIFFQTRPFSWGWATWNDRWELEDFNKEIIKDYLKVNPGCLPAFNKECGNDMKNMLLNCLAKKNDSWYVRWAFSHHINKCYSLYPKYSFVENIGYGQLGTHCKGVNSYKYKLIDPNNLKIKFLKFSFPKESSVKQFLNYFSFYYKLKYRISLLRTKVGRKELLVDAKSKFSLNYLNKKF